MPAKLYETLFALDATKVSAEGDAIRQTLHELLEKHGATIDIARPWDENGKFAYPINKQKKAYFYIVYYTMESTKQIEMEQDLKLNESLVRHMTIAVEPKWSESILEVAKNETGTRFALKGMHDESTPTGDGIISNDPMVRGEVSFEDAPPPRRRPRGPESEKPE
jgi:small subunit ribosomal protein S6